MEVLKKRNSKFLMELYLDPRRLNETHPVTDDKGNKYTIEDAKKLCQAGQVRDWNMAFGRLIQHDYNVEEVAEFYRQAEQNL